MDKKIETLKKINHAKHSQDLPFARCRASSSTLCFVCLTTNVSKRASSTRERRRDGYPF